MLIDTHAHLYWDSFEKDFDQILERALLAGVTHIINVGVDIPTSKASAKLESERIKFYSSIGIHPHEAFKYFKGSLQEDITNLERIYLDYPTKVVAVGECGLDYALGDPGSSPSSLSVQEIKDLQKKLLSTQVKLAKKLNLPLIIHCRDNRSKDPQNSECWNDTIRATKDSFGIYHCYSGLIETTKRVLKETKFFISFAATLTYPKTEYLMEAVKIVPIERILLETDCPFLPPQSKRGQRNEPAYIRETAATLANIKGVSIEDLSYQTSLNAQSIFKLKG